VEDNVFAASFIPRRLEEVAHYERDREALMAGQKVRRRPASAGAAGPASRAAALCLVAAFARGAPSGPR
jgi:hypothetical protein